MTKINRAMRRPPGAPPEWVCNASTAHDEEAEQCYCASCLMEMDARLLKGSPQDSERYPAAKLEERGYVGMYTKKPEFYIPCNECHQGIPVSDPKHVAAARSGESLILHYDCLPEKQRKGALVSPYVLVKPPKKAASA